MKRQMPALPMREYNKLPLLVLAKVQTCDGMPIAHGKCTWRVPDTGRMQRKPVKKTICNKSQKSPACVKLSIKCICLPI